MIDRLPHCTRGKVPQWLKKLYLLTGIHTMLNIPITLRWFPKNSAIVQHKPLALPYQNSEGVSKDRFPITHCHSKTLRPRSRIPLKASSMAYPSPPALPTPTPTLLLPLAPELFQAVPLLSRTSPSCSHAAEFQSLWSLHTANADRCFTSGSCHRKVIMSPAGMLPMWLNSVTVGILIMSWSLVGVCKSCISVGKT